MTARFKGGKWKVSTQSQVTEEDLGNARAALLDAVEEVRMLKLRLEMANMSSRFWEERAYDLMRDQP